MSIFKSLAAKLCFLAGVSALGLVISSVVSYNAVQQLDGAIGALSEKRIPITRLIGEVRIHINAITRMMWQFSAAEDAARKKEIAAKVEARMGELQDTFQKLDEIGLVPKNKANLDLLRKEWAPMETQYKKILTSIEGQDLLQRLQIMDRLTPDMEALVKILTAMGDVMLEANLKARAESSATSQNMKTVVLSVAIGFISLSILASVLLILKLSKTFNAITEKLGSSATHVSSASEELAKASTSLSSSSVEAASSLEETVASLEEINSQVMKSSELAAQAQILGEATRAAAQKGDSQIQRLMDSMNEIEKSSRKINEIISMIDDIAFQTNLLSLNAAVEAARAGDHGKGFAVVAEAVRALSQRSASSAKEISTLIQESADKTTAGVEYARLSSEAVQEILLSVEKLAQLNTEVASASQEQALGIKQISQATNQLDTATQTNASTSEEAAATAEELSAQSRELHHLVDELGEIVEGEKRRGLRAA